MANDKRDFQWIQRVEVARDTLNSERVRLSQRRIMKKFFDSKAHAKDLVAWRAYHSYSDLPLFAVFGLVDPVDYEALFNHMERWQDSMVTEEIQNSIQNPENAGAAFISTPPKKVSLLLKYLADQNFDAYINLCLRLDKPIKLVAALSTALYMEEVRTDQKGKVSVVDELMCQRATPVDEDAGWVWMNKMAIGKGRSPLGVRTMRASSALQKLNNFRIYKALADIRDYGLRPVAFQYIHGKKEECLFQRAQVRIVTALEYLKSAKLIDEGLYDKVIHLSPAARERQLLDLKRAAVTSFASDLVREASNPVQLRELVASFKRYFHGIFAKVGESRVSVEQIISKDKDKRINYTKMVEVSFNQIGKTNRHLGFFNQGKSNY